MQPSEGNKSGQSGEEGPVYRGTDKRSVSRNVNMFSKRMQVYAYTATTVILVGLLIMVGWLYKRSQVDSGDSILMFILAQILGSWVGLTNKIFRITTIGSEKISD
jgi:hypothetical protein